MSDRTEPSDAAIELAHRLLDAARNGDADLLSTYLDAGVPVEMTAATGDTLLMLAAYHGHAGIVQDLVDRGADPNRANERGQTPLGGAVFKGFVDVVRVLVANGADPDAGTPTARAAAQMFERPDLLEILDR